MTEEVKFCGGCWMTEQRYLEEEYTEGDDDFKTYTCERCGEGFCTCCKSYESERNCAYCDHIINKDD